MHGGQSLAGRTLHQPPSQAHAPFGEGVTLPGGFILHSHSAATPSFPPPENYSPENCQFLSVVQVCKWFFSFCIPGHPTLVDLIFKDKWDKNLILSLSCVFYVFCHLFFPLNVLIWASPWGRQLKPMVPK